MVSYFKIVDNLYLTYSMKVAEITCRVVMITMVLDE